MDIGSKILTGVVATVVLALVGHAATGERFISGLEETARTELAARGLDGASVSLGHDPLSREAFLAGDLPEAAKEEALSLVMAIPGVSSASWKSKQATETPAEDGHAKPAAPDQKVANCQAEVDKIVESRKIQFRPGSPYVSLEARQILDRLASALKNCDDLSIAVEGHTDDNGDREVNRVMSQERADRIKAGLVERGISESRITATGYGSSRPRAKGSNAAADAQNRRIEFRIGTASGAAGNGAEAQQGR